MKAPELKAWAGYYRTLILVSAWNGFTIWLYGAAGVEAAQLAGKIDVRAFGWSGAGWSLLGTIVVRVAAALYKHQLPEPAEPVRPTG